tara:strand:- start:408 stop:572 length:165 start_codon:yes stop_codon:yes gene_type:complete
MKQFMKRHGWIIGFIFGLIGVQLRNTGEIWVVMFVIMFVVYLVTGHLNNTEEEV